MGAARRAGADRRAAGKLEMLWSCRPGLAVGWRRPVSCGSDGRVRRAGQQVYRAASAVPIPIAAGAGRAHTAGHGRRGARSAAGDGRAGPRAARRRGRLRWRIGIGLTLFFGILAGAMSVLGYLRDTRPASPTEAPRRPRAPLLRRRPPAIDRRHAGGMAGTAATERASLANHPRAHRVTATSTHEMPLAGTKARHGSESRHLWRCSPKAPPRRVSGARSPSVAPGLATAFPLHPRRTA